MLYLNNHYFIIPQIIQLIHQQILKTFLVLKKVNILVFRWTQNQCILSYCTVIAKLEPGRTTNENMWLLFMNPIWRRTGDSYVWV